MTVRQIAVAGSSGRMGRTLLEAVFQAPDMRLHAALDRHDSPFLGKDAGELVGSPCGVFITDQVEQALNGAHALIDFTRPEGTMAHVEVCRRLHVGMVIGTTGLSAEQKSVIAEAAREIPIM